MSTTVYTLGQAAKHTNLTKSALSRAIKQGRLCAAKQDDGSFEIDVAELGRFVSERKHGQRSQPYNQQDTQRFVNPTGTAPATPESTAIQVRLAELEAKLTYKEALLNDRERQLAEARADLERWRDQATRLLEGPRQDERKPKPGWWDRLLGRG